MSRQDAIPDDKLLTEAQLAELLQVSVRTIQRWRAEGGGPPVVWASSRRPRYWLSEVRDWLKTSKRQDG